MAPRRMRGVLLIVLGFVLGFALALAVPAVAHFSGSTSYRHDWGHVKTLQSQVADLRSRVVSLEAKTSNLDFLGLYTADIDADQVDTPFFCSGEPAVWRSLGQGLEC